MNTHPLSAETAPISPAGLRSIALPNGQVVFGLHKNDTLCVYKDIFEDDCYRLHGVTIADGDCILDVGANTGIFVVFLNSILKKAKVYCFEPVPDIFNVLSQNVARHNKLDVELFNIGLSGATGEATFTFYPRFSNASTLYPDESPEAIRRGRQYVIDQIPTLPWPLCTLLLYVPDFIKQRVAERFRRYYLKPKTVTCKLRNLSEFIREHAITRIDLLKMDAEGSENHILGGLSEEDWPKIRQMVIEAHGGDQDTQAMVANLQQRGFRTAIEPNPAIPTLSLVYAVRAH